MWTQGLSSHWNGEYYNLWQLMNNVHKKLANIKQKFCKTWWTLLKKNMESKKNLEWICKMTYSIWFWKTMPWSRFLVQTTIFMKLKNVLWTILSSSKGLPFLQFYNKPALHTFMTVIYTRVKQVRESWRRHFLLINMNF